MLKSLDTPGSDSSSVKALDSACFKENEKDCDRTRWGEGGVEDLGTSLRTMLPKD